MPRGGQKEETGKVYDQLQKQIDKIKKMITFLYVAILM
jgi:hypothetical protein